MATSDEFDMKLSFSVDKSSVDKMINDFDNITKKVLSNSSKNLSGMGGNLTQTIQKMISKSSQMFKKAGKMLSSNLLNISPSDYKNFSTTIQKVFTNINKSMTTKDGGKQLKKELNNLTTLMNNFRSSVKDVRFDVPFKESSKSTISEIHKLTKTFDNLFSQMTKSKQGKVGFPSLKSLQKELKLTEAEATKFQKELEHIFRKGKSKNIGWSAQQLGLNKTYKSISEFYQKYLGTTKNGENKIAAFKKKEYKEQIRELRNFFDKQEKEIKEFNITSQRLNKQTKGFGTLGKQQIGQGETPQQPPQNIFGRMVGKVKSSGIVQGLTDIHHGFMMVQGAVRGVARAVTAIKDSYKELDEGVRLASTLIDNQTLTAIGGMNKLKDITRDISVLFGSDIPTATNAMYKALTSGAPAENLQEVMTVANKLAVGGKANFDVVVDGMTSMVNAFGDLDYSMGSLTRVSDAMFTAMKYGKFDLETLSHNLGQITTQAANMGMSMEEAVSTLAALTRTGLGAEQAATQIRSALKKLLDPSKGAQKIMNELGIAYGKNALEGGTFIDVITGMKTKLEDAGYGLQDVFEDVRGLQGMISLTSNTTEVYNDLMRDMTLNHQALGATTQQAFNKMSDSLAVWENRSKSAFNSFLSGIGESMSPAILSWNKFITGIFESSSQKSERMIEEFRNVSSAYKSLDALSNKDNMFFTEEDINNQSSFNRKIETLGQILPDVAKKFKIIAESGMESSKMISVFNMELDNLIEKYRILADIQAPKIKKAIVESQTEQFKSIFENTKQIIKDETSQRKKIDTLLSKLNEQQINDFRKFLEDNNVTKLMIQYLNDFDISTMDALHKLAKENETLYKYLDVYELQYYSDTVGGEITFNNLTEASYASLNTFLNTGRDKVSEYFENWAKQGDIALKSNVESYIDSVIKQFEGITPSKTLDNFISDFDQIEIGLKDLPGDTEKILNFSREYFNILKQQKEKELTKLQIQKEYGIEIGQSNQLIKNNSQNYIEAINSLNEMKDITLRTKKDLTDVLKNEMTRADLSNQTNFELKKQKNILSEMKINIKDMANQDSKDLNEELHNIYDTLGLSKDLLGDMSMDIPIIGALKFNTELQRILSNINSILGVSDNISKDESIFDTSFITKDSPDTSKKFIQLASTQLENFVISTRDELSSLSPEDMLPDKISDLMSKAVFDPAKLGDRLQETLSSIDVSTDNIDFSIDDILLGDVELPGYLENIREQLMGMKETLMATDGEELLLGNLLDQLPDDLTSRILTQIQELKNIGFIGEDIASDIESQFAAGKKAALQELEDLYKSGKIKYAEMVKKQAQINKNFNVSVEEIHKRTYESMFNFAILKATELYSLEQQYINEVITLINQEKSIRETIYSIVNNENISLDNKRNILQGVIDALSVELASHKLITSELRTQAQIEAQKAKIKTLEAASELGQNIRGEGVIPSVFTSGDDLTDRQIQDTAIYGVEGTEAIVGKLDKLAETMTTLEDLSGTMEQVEKNTEDTKKTNEAIVGNTGKSASLTETGMKKTEREQIGQPTGRDQDKFFFSQDIDWGLGEKFLVDKKFNVQFENLIDEMLEFQKQTERIITEQLLQMNLIMEEAGYVTISNIRKEYEQIKVTMEDISADWTKQYKNMVEANVKESERAFNEINNEMKSELAKYINSFSILASSTTEVSWSESDYAGRSAELDEGEEIAKYINSNIEAIQKVLDVSETSITRLTDLLLKTEKRGAEIFKEGIKKIQSKYSGITNTVTAHTENISKIPDEIQNQFSELMKQVLKNPASTIGKFHTSMRTIIDDMSTNSEFLKLTETEQEKIKDQLREIGTNIMDYLRSYSSQIEAVNSMLLSMENLNYTRLKLGVFIDKQGVPSQLTPDNFATAVDNIGKISTFFDELETYMTGFFSAVNIDQSEADNLLNDIQELQESSGVLGSFTVTNLEEGIRYIKQNVGKIFSKGAEKDRIKLVKIINNIYRAIIDPLTNKDVIDVAYSFIGDESIEKTKEAVISELNAIINDPDISVDKKNIAKGLKIAVESGTFEAITQEFGEGMQLWTIEFMQYLREESLKEGARVKYIKETYNKLQDMTVGFGEDILNTGELRDPLEKFRLNIEYLNDIISENLSKVSSRSESHTKDIKQLAELYTTAMANLEDGMTTSPEVESIKQMALALKEWGLTYREVFEATSKMTQETQQEFLNMYESIITEQADLLGEYEDRVVEAYRQQKVILKQIEEWEEKDPDFLDAEVEIDLDGDSVVDTVTTLREVMEREAGASVINAQKEYQNAIIELSREFNTQFAEMLSQYYKEIGEFREVFQELVDGIALNNIREQFGELEAQLATLSQKAHENFKNAIAPLTINLKNMDENEIVDDLKSTSTRYTSQESGGLFSGAFVKEEDYKEEYEELLNTQENLLEMLEAGGDERDKALDFIRRYNLLSEEELNRLIKQLEIQDEFIENRKLLTELEERALKDKELELKTDTSILDLRQQIAELQIEISRGSNEFVGKTLANLELAKDKVTALIGATWNEQFKLASGEIVYMWQILEGHVTNLNGLTETQLETVNKTLEALKEEKKLRSDIIDAMLEEISLEEEYWQSKLSGSETLSSFVSAIFSGRRLDQARKLSSEENRQKAINEIRDSEEFKDLEKDTLDGAMSVEDATRFKELKEQINALKEADLVDPNQLAKLEAEFSSSIIAIGEIIGSVLDGVFSTVNEKGEISLNQLASNLYDLTADIIAGIGGPIGAAVSVAMKLAKQIGEFLLKLWRRHGYQLAENYENQVALQNMINEKIQRQVELTELLVNINHEVANSLQKQIDLYNELLETQYDFNNADEAIDFIENETDRLDAIKEALVTFVTSGAEGRWGENFGLDPTDDDWFNANREILEDLGITWEDFKAGKYTAESIRKILEASAESSESNLENAEEYLDLLKKIAETEKERLETYSKFQQTYLELTGFNRASIEEQIALTLELISRSGELRMSEEEVIELMLKEAELRRQMVEYLEELLQKEQELVYLRSQVVQNEEYQTTYLNLLGTQDLIIAKQYELQEAISAGLGDDTIIQLKEELLQLQLQEIELQEKLYEGIQQEYEYRSRIVDLEGDIAVKRARLAGYGDSFIQAIELDVLNEQIMAKQAEYNRLEESIGQLQAEGLVTTEQEEQLLGLENELLDLQLQRLETQRAMNGEIANSSALYDEQLRAYLRSVIQARQTGDVEREQEAKQNAAYRLLELGVTPEEIYRMLGIDVGIGDIGGLTGSDDYDYEEPDIDTGTGLEGEMPSIDDLIVAIDEWIGTLTDLDLDEEPFIPGKTRGGWLYEVMTDTIVPALAGVSIDTGMIQPGYETFSNSETLEALRNINQTLKNNTDTINNNIGINIDNKNISTKMSNSDKIRNTVKTERTLKG